MLKRLSTGWLRSVISSQEIGDERYDQKNRVDPSDEQGSPKAGKDGGIETVVAAEQDGEHERREGVGDEKRGELKVKGSIRCLR